MAACNSVEQFLRAAFLSIALAACMPAIAQSSPPAQKPSALEQAREFSKKGVGLLFHLEEGREMAGYKPALRDLMLSLKKEGIPAYISGGTVERGRPTGLYFIVREIPWPMADEGPYSIDQVRSGKVLQDIRSVYARSRDDREFLKLLSAALEKRVENIDAEIAKLNSRIKANEKRMKEIGGGR